MSDVTIDRMIEVMQAYKNGAKVQYSYIGGNSWVEAEGPLWNWAAYTYRVAPKEYTQEEARALDEEVQRLRAIQNGDRIKNTKTCSGVPEELPPNTRIKAVFDDGSVRNEAPASNWKHCWDSSVSPHIAKYRIVK